MKKLLIIIGVLLVFTVHAKAQEESERSTKAMGGFGLVSDWRVKFFFNGGFYSGLNRSQYFWSAEDVRFETNARNIPTSETSISDHRWMGVLIGKPF
ncbi:MAG: hypothetical protein AAB497_03040 [Patescibacteria group bacterium]